MAHPHMHYDPEGPIKRLRELCLALPEATEKERGGIHLPRRRQDVRHDLQPSSRRRHVSVWVKATLMVQEILVNADPQRFFKPPYVGHKGWLGVRLDVPEVDWEELAELLRDGYLMTAPKRLAKLGGPKDALPQPAEKPRTRSQAPPRRTHVRRHESMVCRWICEEDQP